MTKTFVLVSFATAPNSGSERGVGWAFFLGALELAEKKNFKLEVIVDGRDEAEIRRYLEARGKPSEVRLNYVNIPKKIRKLVGKSKSRLSYLVWLPYAARALKRLVKEQDVLLVHQVTFASFVLPSVMERHSFRKYRAVWGPANIALISDGTWPKTKPIKDLIHQYLRRYLSWVALQNTSYVDLAIANNKHTYEIVRSRNKDLEPNIFLTLGKGLPDVEKSALRIVVVGALVSGKRPWVAIDVLCEPKLRDFKLQYVGDGELRKSLEDYAARRGVRDRVDFLGKKTHQETLNLISGASVLLHPSSHEGSPWVVGEANTLGTPAIVVEGTGSDTTLLISQASGTVIRDSKNMVSDMAESILAWANVPGQSSQRWNAERASGLLERWWLNFDWQ